MNNQRLNEKKTRLSVDYFEKNAYNKK